MLNKIAILLIILAFLIFSETKQAVTLQFDSLQTDSRDDKKQDKGPVYNPLRQKPYVKTIYKA